MKELHGSYTKNIHKGDIVIGIDAINITSIEPKGEGKNIEDYEITTYLHGEENKLIYRKADENLINFIKQKFDNNNLHFGTIGSGDVFNKNTEVIKHINKRYEAICEDMECISIYTVSNLCDIPVISIKGISNNEVLGEKYDYTVSEKLQKFVKEVVVELCRINLLDK